MLNLFLKATMILLFAIYLILALVGLKSLPSLLYEVAIAVILILSLVGIILMWWRDR